MTPLPIAGFDANNNRDNANTKGMEKDISEKQFVLMRLYSPPITRGPTEDRNLAYMLNAFSCVATSTKALRSNKILHS